jgi:hypothetical protein
MLVCSVLLAIISLDNVKKSNASRRIGWDSLLFLR